MSRRKGEDDRTHFRTPRIIEINHRWYFMVRETEEPIGPYGSRSSAAKEAEQYLKDLEKYPNPTLLYRPIRS